MSPLRQALSTTALKALLRTRSQTGGVGRALDRLALPMAQSIEGEVVTVAAVQLASHPVPTVEAYAGKMARLVGEAVEQGSQLVVFPEYSGLPLLGLVPGVGESGISAGLDQAGLAVANLLQLVLPSLEPVWQRVAAELAARCGIYLMAGTMPQKAPSGSPRPYYNSAFLYGPDGHLIVVQPKLHLVERELAWTCPGDDLHVADLGWSQVALPVCMDYTYWEIARVAALQGAEILLSPVAEPTAADPWRQARGLRGRVQETPVYGVQSCLVGDLWGETATGATAIYAPLGLFSALDDTLAEAQTIDQEEVVVAQLDLGALRQFRLGNPADFNPTLYRRYLPSLYG